MGKYLIHYKERSIKDLTPLDAHISEDKLVKSKMVCFCDIPVGDLSIHMTK